jgi:hypothetical protein
VCTVVFVVLLGIQSVQNAFGADCMTDDADLWDEMVVFEAVE